MSLVPSLLQAIVKIDGEAMVMHPGDKPYVVSPRGQVDLASRGLTLDAINGILGQLLPAEIHNALDEFGAISYELPSRSEFPHEHFTVVAARGGDDVWVEIRRRRMADDDRVPEEFFTPQPAPPAAAVAPAVTPAPIAPAIAPAPPQVVAMPAAAARPAAVVAQTPQAVAHQPAAAVAQQTAAVAAQQTAAVAAQPAPAVVAHQAPAPVVAPPAPAVVAQAAPLQPPIVSAPVSTTNVVAGAADEDEGEEINLDEDLVLPAESELFGQGVTGSTESEFDGEEHEIDLDAEEEIEPTPVAEQVDAVAATAMPPAQDLPAPIAVARVAEPIAPAPANIVPQVAASDAHLVQPVGGLADAGVAVEQIVAHVEPAVVAPSAEETAVLEPLVAQPAAEIAEPFGKIEAPVADEVVVEVPALESVSEQTAPQAAAPIAEVEQPVAEQIVTQVEPEVVAPVAEEAVAPVAAVETVAGTSIEAPVVEPIAAATEPEVAVPMAAEVVAPVAAEVIAPVAEVEEPIVEELVAQFDAELAEPVAEESAAVVAEIETVVESSLAAPAIEMEPVFDVLAPTEPDFVEAVAHAEPFIPDAALEPEPMVASAAMEFESRADASAAELLRPPFVAPIAREEEPVVEAVAPLVEPAPEIVEVRAVVATIDVPVATAGVQATPIESRTGFSESFVAPAVESADAPRPVTRAVEREQPMALPQPAVVLPISRSPIRADQAAASLSDVAVPGLDRLLRLAAARGASRLYLSSDSRPSVRVDGELQMLDSEPLHSARDVESLLLTLMPERNAEAMRIGAETEWISDIEGVGRVRSMCFRDHRGPGGVFRLMASRSVSVEQLGLPRQVQSLVIEAQGLVLVAGPRSSGKRTLMAAFVDLMNRTRRDHIITLEREINIVHDGGNSFVSQREVRGSDEEMLAAARAALREDPDVLVIEDLHTAALMNVALEAAASGHLVVGGFPAQTATDAVDRIIDLYEPEHRRQIQYALADTLRGVVVQALLRKIGGGRLAAREVLLNTPAVSSVISEGKTSQLPMAIEGGRRHGMVPLNDALVALVQSGAVEAREAYRQSPDRPGFLAALTRQGLDTSFVERFA